MEKIVLKVKGIVKKEDKYLVVKHWYDDRIPDPFMWEFIDGEVAFGESPVKAMQRSIMECLSVQGTVIKPVYTWSNLVGDTQIVGVSFLCEVGDEEEFNLGEDFGAYEWIKKEEFEDYIENQYVRNDIMGVELE